MSHSETTVWAAITAMDEWENLPALIGMLKDQTWKNVRVLFCINQPDSWWDRPDKLEICQNNQRSLKFLKSISGLNIIVVDKSTRGLGWTEKRKGVGWARKILMDRISLEADPGDLIISLDADVRFSPDYFASVVESFRIHTRAVALSIPYYHELVDDPMKNRVILRYEIYMRYYAINLWFSNSPYSFTAIGSAIALPVAAYRAIGGITPHPGGEDFYLVQKLLKYGPVLVWNDHKVYPATRYSDRVGFGTGPAMKRGIQGDWSSYPLYPRIYFDSIKETIQLFGELHNETDPTPMDDFLKEKFKEDDLWKPLRTNSRSLSQFVRACHTKIDGLRTLQYLKWRHREKVQNDEKTLEGWLEQMDPRSKQLLEPGSLSFEKSPVGVLDSIRNRLVILEETLQQKNKILQL
jgi:hypothetical protein